MYKSGRLAEVWLSPHLSWEEATLALSLQDPWESEPLGSEIPFHQLPLSSAAMIGVAVVRELVFMGYLRYAVSGPYITWWPQIFPSSLWGELSLLKKCLDQDCDALCLDQGGNALCLPTPRALGSLVSRLLNRGEESGG